MSSILQALLTPHIWFSGQQLVTSYPDFLVSHLFKDSSVQADGLQKLMWDELSHINGIPSKHLPNLHSETSAGQSKAESNTSPQSSNLQSQDEL